MGVRWKSQPPRAPDSQEMVLEFSQSLVAWLDRQPDHSNSARGKANVSGPDLGVSTDRAIALWDGTTGSKLLDSITNVSPGGALTLGDGTLNGLYVSVLNADSQVGGFVVTGSTLHFTIPELVAYGGMFGYSWFGPAPAGTRVIDVYHAGNASPEGVITANNRDMAFGLGLAFRPGYFIHYGANGTNTGWKELSVLRRLTLYGADSSAIYPILALTSPAEGNQWLQDDAACRRFTSPNATISLQLGGTGNEEVQFDIAGVHHGLVRKNGTQTLGAAWARVNTWTVETDALSLWVGADSSWTIPATPDFNEIRVKVQTSLENTDAAVSAVGIGIGTAVLDPDNLPGNMVVRGDFNLPDAATRPVEWTMQEFQSFWIPVTGNEKFSVWGKYLDGGADILDVNGGGKAITWFAIETRQR